MNLADAIKAALVSANKVAKEKVVESAEEFFDPFERLDDQLSHLDKQEEEYGKLVDSAMTDQELAQVLDKIDVATQSKANTKEIAEFSVDLMRIARKVFLA